LSGIVRDAFGIPARDYLRSRQLDYAAELLRSTSLTVAEIAVSSAFGTESTFSRCFGAAFGTTPGRYRHLMKCWSAAATPPTRTALHPDRR
jgi:AraC-like DNA-binding protein